MSHQTKPSKYQTSTNFQSLPLFAHRPKSSSSVGPRAFRPAIKGVKNLVLLALVIAHTPSTRPDAFESLPSRELASAQTINADTYSIPRSTNFLLLPTTYTIPEPQGFDLLFFSHISLLQSQDSLAASLPTRQPGTSLIQSPSPFTLSSPFHQLSSARPTVRLRDPATSLERQSLNSVGQCLSGNSRASLSSLVHLLLLFRDRQGFIAIDKASSRPTRASPQS
ncbi:hypothetical protein QBC34DRAFT_85846 [Podospora aff. communis PSN243]|uniref:Uncharacterized protein n=1 Tax=Podospora aff. communis PSN243 TaxID=3040156 RepID=A0AAV9GQK3_9PEZI|nr:hypothetical protein QBC34DRAFT_85846 [Podospora aff. communis PSN243]